MQGAPGERKGLPLACLSLLVPPLRLASAALWRALQRREVLAYGPLEEFVTMVTSMVPELLKNKQRAELSLGLRARLVLELCQSGSPADLQNIQPHLERMDTLTALWSTQDSDVDVGLFGSKFSELVQTLLKDPGEKQRFFQDVFPVRFGPGYDAAMQSLMLQFLSRLEKLLPQQNLQQVASLLGEGSCVLEECLGAVCGSQQLATLLQHHRGLGQLHHDDTLSDGGCIFSALCPPVKQATTTSQQTHSETHVLSMNDYMDSFINEMEVEVATEEHKELPGGMSHDVQEQEEVSSAAERPVDVEPGVGQALLLGQSGEEVAGVGGVRPREGGAEDGAMKVIIGEDGLVVPFSGGEDGLVVPFSGGEDGLVVPSIGGEDGLVVPSSGGEDGLVVPSIGGEDGLVVPSSGGETENKKGKKKRKQRTDVADTLPPPAAGAGKRNGGLKKRKMMMLQEQKPTETKISNICGLCGKMFSRYADAVLHQKAHMWNRAFQCPECYKRFKDSAALAEHQQTSCAEGRQEKTARPQLKCPLCEWTFGSASQIERHMKSHSSERPYRCGNCKSTFKHLSSAKAHEEACLFASLQRGELPSGGITSSPAAGLGDPQTPGSTPQKPALQENDMQSSSEVQLNSALAGPSQKAMESLACRTCPVCSQVLQHPALMEQHLRTCRKDAAPGVDGSDPIQVADKDSDVSTSDVSSYLSVTKTPKQVRSCRVCGKNVVGYMKYHMRSHAEKRPHYCPHCGLMFKFPFGLRRHMRQFCKMQRGEPVEGANVAKERKTSNKCDECEKEFGLKSTLKAHKVTHNPLYCAECRKVCPDLETLAAHNIKHRPVQCTMCEKTFTVTRFLNKHYQDVHDFSGPFVCAECHKSYTDLGAFIRHERTHTGDLPFQCSHCSKGFNGYQNLVIHERKHTGENPYLCWECGKGFRSKDVLDKHTAYRHGSQEKKALSCPQCEKTFWTKTLLNQHVDAHHKGIRYPCSYCGKLFLSASALVRHDLIHTGERPFSCTHADCGKTFKSKSELKVHTRYHTGERPFKCEVCGKGFVQAHYLTTHLRSHTKERPYACTLCEKAFTTGNQLKRHHMVHTGEKPFKCLECDKAFSHRHSLQDHLEKYQHTS